MSDCLCGDPTCIGCAEGDRLAAQCDDEMGAWGDIEPVDAMPTLHKVAFGILFGVGLLALILAVVLALGMPR